MHKIYQFSRENGEGEFIVISDSPRDDVIAEFMADGYPPPEEYTINDDCGDATSLPCDQELTPTP